MTKLKSLEAQLKLIKFDADTLDGYHVAQLAGGGPHTHVPSDIVGSINAGTLEGSTKAQVQDHAPASHGNSSHTSAFGLVSDIAVNANLSTGAQDAVTKRHAQNGDTDLDATFEATLEKVANKGAVNGYAGLDSGGKVPDAQIPDAITRDTELAAHAALTTGVHGVSAFQQEALIECYPYGGTPVVTLTPTGHGASVAMVFPFEIDRPITINALYIKSVAVVATCLIVGIFNSAGTQVLRTAALGTVAGWVAVTGGTTPSLPVTLPAGTYYLATTNNGVTSATAAYTTTPALGTATLPRWGTVAATAGAMPASITPGSITKTVGGWMCYILLSNVTS